LGHSEQELERLAIQARLIDPITRRFFLDAGIVAGMRVLDVGSGAGDTAFLAAEIVGADGEVIGIDRAGAAVKTANDRARDKELRNITFIESDPMDARFETQFDAIVGRYVLMFQPDPVPMLRKLIQHLRPGGIVVFHEPYLHAAWSFPPVPTYDLLWRRMAETMQRSGADSRMGAKLHSTFLAVGLPAPTLRLESVVGGGANGIDQIHLITDVTRTLLPEMERLGVATAGEVGIETLADRICAEMIANSSVIVGRAEIGAWSRITARVKRTLPSCRE
ncbi:MAG: class I SAM-dependent methyltransferase, partial [Methylococcales bacterium]